MIWAFQELRTLHRYPWPRLLQPALRMLGVLLLCAGTAQSQPLAPSDAAADLDTLLRTFEAVHPDLYRRTSQGAIEQQRAVLHRTLERPLSRRAFYVAAARLAAAFRDGHTRVMLPLDAYEAAARTGTRTFPATVVQRNGALYVRRSCVPHLPQGAQLHTINERDAAVLFQTVQTVISGADVYQQAIAGAQFPWLLWAHEVEAPFQISYTPPGPAATTHTRTFPGLSFADVRTCLTSPTPPYAFQRRAGVGILTLHQLKHPMQFRQFLEDVANRLAAQPVRGLVVDLRQCTGGRTKVARLLLGALTDRPFRLAVRKDWKVSRPYKTHLRTFAAADHPYLEHPTGRTLTINYQAQPPPDAPLQYEGPVVVLVGPRTFSSAVTLAASLKTQGVATVVGQETGGRVHRFGEGYSFRLPHSGLRAMVSSAYLVHDSRPRDWDGGVPPHVSVTPPRPLGTDVALGVALSHIHERSQ